MADVAARKGRPYEPGYASFETPDDLGFQRDMLRLRKLHKSILASE